MAILPYQTLLVILSYLALNPVLLSAFASPLDHRNEFVQREASAPTPWQYQITGDSGVSAQMLFYGGGSKVYILDKAENNPVTVTSTDGTTHPAWAVEYDYLTNTYRTMDVWGNTFCAAGMTMANGTWAIFGGNQPVTTGGVAVTGEGAYDDEDGGAGIRLLNPCTDESCEYIQTAMPYDYGSGGDDWLQMTGRRWYPTIEPLEDGTLIVIGGDQNGGYVNTAAQDNPTYEFFPKHADDPQDLQFLADCLPVNLFPLTWLLPSGNLFLQANRSTILLDYKTKNVTNLPDMPYAVRVYPASAATAMLPLTPANNYTASILFCGGSNPPQWGDDVGPGYNVTAIPADNSCVRISPDDPNPQYEDDDFMHQGRSMGQFIFLPDGTMWMGNGVGMGTAGYGNQGYSTGQSYGQAPIYTPGLYNPFAPLGSRWNFSLPASTEERMYHSTAVLLPDGSLIIGGSNPNADFTTVQWGTKSTIERWYPSWYNEPRPGTLGFPSNLTYGGNYWSISLNTTDETSIQSAVVNVIRPGFSTHAMNMGQRFLQLETSYLLDNVANTSTLYVSQMPPNPALFQPGPAYLFLVIDGVPSWGEYIMIGSGVVETQPTAAVQALPASKVNNPVVVTTSTSATAGGASATAQSNAKTGAAIRITVPGSLMASIAGLFFAVLFGLI